MADSHLHGGASSHAGGMGSALGVVDVPNGGPRLWIITPVHSSDVICAVRRQELLIRGLRGIAPRMEKQATAAGAAVP